MASELTGLPPTSLSSILVIVTIAAILCSKRTEIPSS